MTKLPPVLFAVALFVSSAAGLRASAQTRRSPDEARAAKADGAQFAEKAEARFVGLGDIKDDVLWLTLRQERTGVAKSFDYDPAKIVNAVRVVREYLARRGYLRAEVEAREEVVAAGPRRFTFEVNAGERARVAEVRFEGHKAVPASRLAESLKQCMDDRREGDFYDSELIRFCLMGPLRVYRAEGYLLAEFGEPSKEETDRGLIITVPTEEGVRYRVGKIRVKGATVFLPEQIVEMLDLRAGDIADQSKLVRAVERIESEYEDRGRLGLFLDAEPTYRKVKKGASEGVVDFEIDIREGLPHTVYVTFTGHRLKTEKELRDALSVSDGELFNRRKLLDGLENLRRMGVFRGSFEGLFGGGHSSVNVTSRFNSEEGLILIEITISEGRALEDDW